VAPSPSPTITSPRIPALYIIEAIYQLTVATPRDLKPSSII